MGAIAPASAKRPASTSSSLRFFLDMPASFHSTVSTSHHRKTKQVICHYATLQGFFHINELTVGVRETLSRAHRLCLSICRHVSIYMCDKRYEFGDRKLCLFVSTVT